MEGAAALIFSMFAAPHLHRLTLRSSLTPRPSHWESASLFILWLNNSQLRLDEAVLQKAGVTEVEVIEAKSLIQVKLFFAWFTQT